MPFHLAYAMTDHSYPPTSSLLKSLTVKHRDGEPGLGTETECANERSPRGKRDAT
jgi:hypothetical protein